MPDDISDIRAFYEAAVEKEGGRLERHPVEKDITWRYLETYLPAEGKLLEIGAATGSYTIPLAQRGYRVTAVDMASGLLELCRQRANEEGLGAMVTCVVADARDLSPIQDNEYDAVLLMGPLYHLVEEEDRKTALREATARLKQGGIIFSAFISRYGIWGDVMMKLPHYIDYQEHVASVFEKGRDAPEPQWQNNFRAYFATVPEIAPLHEQFAIETLVLAAAEPCGIAADMSYGELDEPRRQKWLDLMYNLSTEPSIIGASCHLLYIGKKL
jgi:SAM-dependent methyltransferase